MGPHWSQSLASVDDKLLLGRRHSWPNDLLGHPVDALEDLVRTLRLVNDRILGYGVDEGYRDVDD